MKEKVIKTVILFLIILQAGLGIKSFLTIRSIVVKSEIIMQSPLDQVILFSFLSVSVLISVLLIVFLFRSIESYEDVQMDKTMKTEIKDKKEQKQQREDEKQRQQALAEKKKAMVEELMKDLNTGLSLQNYCDKVLINISKQYGIMQALFFIKDQNDKIFRKAGAYAYFSQEELREFSEDIGLSGQVASSKKLLNISNIPEKYITVHSGLGLSSPTNLVIFPVLCNNESIGIVELASFAKFDSFTEEILMACSTKIGNHLEQIRHKNAEDSI